MLINRFVISYFVSHVGGVWLEKFLLEQRRSWRPTGGVTKQVERKTGSLSLYPFNYEIKHSV